MFRNILNGGDIGPSGVVTLRKYSKQGLPTLSEILKNTLPQKDLPREIYDWRKANSPNILRGLKNLALPKLFKTASMQGILSLAVYRPSSHLYLLDEAMDAFRNNALPGIAFPLWAQKYGINFEIVPLGIASLRVVTDDGVDYIVDAFQNSVELEDMKYHGIGETNTAEDQTDSDLVAELTTEYSSDNTRATGTTTEGGSTNIYETVATNTVDATVAIVEHGLFNNATVGSGVLFDRSVFTVVNMSSGESLQSTYDGTFSAGS